jgi:alpha-galactosidase
MKTPNDTNSPFLPGDSLSRRKFLVNVGATGALVAGSGILEGAFAADAISEKFMQKLRAAPARAVTVDGNVAGDDIVITREWSGAFCRSCVSNRGSTAVRLQDIVLFALPGHGLGADTPILAEGFSMVNLTVGTLGKPEELCDNDAVFHRRTEKDAANAWGMLALAPQPGDEMLLAFTSCQRFAGKIVANPQRVEVVLDADGLTLAPGQTWDLEEFAIFTGRNRQALLDRLAERIGTHHPRLPASLPMGWCSWYRFGAEATPEQVVRNAAWIATNAPALKVIQIDDGYQPAMGDWFAPGTTFGGGVRDVMEQIRRRGLMPGIWVAPFVASAGSQLFRQHPDWFIAADDGRPILSDANWREAWRQGPWYTLDGTHPGAQKYLEDTFRRMREEWGCRYFKLDANSWGCAPGKHHDPNATRVEAFRRGMEAVLRGAGPDSFILGTNSPMWPSLGLIHGNRSGGDILSGEWKYIKWTSRMNLMRGWQNNRLWWNDPDCLMLGTNRPANETIFHATTVRLTGGMLISSDDLPALTEGQRAILMKLLPPTGVEAQFADTALDFTGNALECGVARYHDRQEIALLNWTEQSKEIPFHLDEPCEVVDFWTDEKLGTLHGNIKLPALPARSARLLVCVPK